MGVWLDTTLGAKRELFPSNAPFPWPGVRLHKVTRGHLTKQNESLEPAVKEVDTFRSVSLWLKSNDRIVAGAT